MLVWSVLADWRAGRVPVISLTKMQYAQRSDAPILFWTFTIVRLLLTVIIGRGVVLFIWRAIVGA